jgi:hypothetical protein
MMFENEFLYAEGTTVSLEQMYENRIKKLTDELNDWKAQLEKRKKELADKKKIAATVIKSGNPSPFAQTSTNVPSEQGIVKQSINQEINSLKGIIYKIENVEIPNKQKELDDVKREYVSLYSKQSKQIAETAMQSAGLSKEEFDQILKTQIEIEKSKIEGKRIKIFVGIGVGLVTLLILFKTLK